MPDPYVPLRHSLRGVVERCDRLADLRQTMTHGLYATGEIQDDARGMGVSRPTAHQLTEQIVEARARAHTALAEAAKALQEERRLLHKLMDLATEAARGRP